MRRCDSWPMFSISRNIVKVTTRKGRIVVRMSFQVKIGVLYCVWFVWRGGCCCLLVGKGRIYWRCWLLALVLVVLDCLLLSVDCYEGCVDDDVKGYAYDTVSGDETVKSFDYALRFFSSCWPGLVCRRVIAPLFPW